MSRRALLAAALLAALVGCRRPALEPPSAPGGRLVIDVRAPADFAAGHHPGALNIQLGWEQLAGRTAAYVPDRATPLAVYAPRHAEVREALEVLRELGYRDVAVAAPPEEPVTSALTTAAQLREELAGPSPPVVIDIRSATELLAGSLPGALLVEQDQGPEGVAGLDRGARYAVICEGGWRSSQLQSWMEREGFEHVENVIDGLAGWRGEEGESGGRR